MTPSVLTSPHIPAGSIGVVVAYLVTLSSRALGMGLPNRSRAIMSNA